MTADSRPSVVTTWFGAFVVDRGRVVRAYPFPSDNETLVERHRTRRAGRLVPEEEQLLREVAPETLVSRDRRLVERGVTLGGPPFVPLAAPEYGFDPAVHRRLLLEEGAKDLRDAWDPSIHVEEAVRSIADLDRVLNTLAERLTSWAGRDTLAIESGISENPRAIAEAIVQGRWAPAAELPGLDPALLEGRRGLAGLYLSTRTTRDALEAAVARALPRRAPNLDHLLGAELAARLISQAGGLERLARLPSSTVQVLGAEKAFFAHLRGRGSSPRHGLLFLHPTIQSAPRAQRGRLARALAGNVSIAARLDLGGAAVDPALRERFERRTREIRAPTRASRARGSRPPLDGAARDR